MRPKSPGWLDGVSIDDAPVYLGGASAVASVVSIAACQILLGLAIVALLATRTKLRWPPVTAALGAWFVLTLISLESSGHIRTGLPQIKKFYAYLILFVLVSVLANVKQVRRIVLWWGLAATFSSAWSMVQFLRKYRAAQAAHEDFYRSYIANRITGFMGHWMTFSGEMMIVLLLLVALLILGRDRSTRAWLAGGGLIILAGLLAAFTRSMWLGAAVGGAYLLWFAPRWLQFAVPVFALAIIAANPFDIRERVVSTVRPHEGDLDSNAHRRVTRRVGAEMIKAHPWLGVGPEQVGPQFESYVPADEPRPLPSGYYGHLHNIYYHFVAERGLPALAALLWFLFQPVWDFWRASLRAPDTHRWFLQGAVAVILAVMAAGYYEVNLGDSEVLSLFLSVIACGYVTIRDMEMA